MNNPANSTTVRPSQLLRAAASVAKCDEAHVASAACKLLRIADAGLIGPSAYSELNWNGFPLQLLFSFRQQKIACRLLGDPGSHLLNPVARYQLGKETLPALLAFAKADALSALTQSLIEQVVPGDPERLAQYAAGTMWLAAGLNSPGMAMYVAPAPSENRWQKAGAWISNVTPAPFDALALIAVLEQSCFLLGVGVEGLSPSTARFKLYWRMTTPQPLSDFGISLLTDPAMMTFLAAALGGGSVTPDALNFSANFDVTSGKLVDVKIDVSWHGRAQQQALQIIAYQAEQLGLATLETHSAINTIRQHQLAVGCIGLGIDAAGKYRLNTYLF
jgi:hypothetical protein